MSPTVFRQGPYRFFFFSREEERVHVHVLSPNGEANFAACNQELVAALIPHDIHTNSGQQLLQCACLLNDAWQSGLASLFAGQQCYQITNYFGDCGLDQFCATDPAQLPEQCDQNLLYDRCFVPVYLGVRAD